MRRILCLAAAVLIAGCGEGGEDFSFEVAMAPDKARAELGKLNGGDFLRALHLRPIIAQRGGQGDLSFVIPGDTEHGTLHLRFEETGPRASRVHVALDLPAATHMIDGEQMVLSESKAERSLKSELESWAKAAGSRGHASLDDLNMTLGGVSVAMQPNKLDQLLAASNDPRKLAGLIDPSFLADEASEDDYDRGDDDTESREAGEPMHDPDAGLAAASAPMDKAEGFDPTPDNY